MPCTPIKLPSGGAAIICTGRRRMKPCCSCPRPGTLLCDWKMGDGKTCDTPICATHGQQVAKDKHLCPDHQGAYRQWLAQRQPRAKVA